MGWFNKWNFFTSKKEFAYVFLSKVYTSKFKKKYIKINFTTLLLNNLTLFIGLIQALQDVISLTFALPCAIGVEHTII